MALNCLWNELEEGIDLGCPELGWEENGLSGGVSIRSGTDSSSLPGLGLGQTVALCLAYMGRTGVHGLLWPFRVQRSGHNE
jgi:hypothetical protein